MAQLPLRPQSPDQITGQIVVIGKMILNGKSAPEFIQQLRAPRSDLKGLELSIY
jgi:DNA-binding FrmR family transcriptional regulator